MEEHIVFAALMPHAPILVPAVGGGELVHVGATVQAMRKVAERAIAAQPDTLVLISPHSPRRPGVFGLWDAPRLLGSLDRFGAPGEVVDLPLDRAFAGRLEQEAARCGLRMWRIEDEDLDHGAVVPLHYLAAAGWKGRTVILSLNYSGEGGIDELGQAIAATARGMKRRTAVIASGDMSHRLMRTAPCGFHPDGRRFDETFIGLLRDGAFDRIPGIDADLQENAAEDVVDSTLIALAAAGGGVAGCHEVLSYEGPFGVGYGVAILFEPRESGAAAAQAAGEEGWVISRLEDLPALARHAVESRLRQGSAKPSNLRITGEAAEPGPVFVTVRTTGGELRGCRGVTEPVEKDMVRETWHCAIAAALFDGRFMPVTAEELPDARFTVTVLGKLEPAASTAELDPAVYGVMVTAGDGRRGVLLPGIEGIDTVDEQLDVVRRKAGITPDEDIRIERFTTRCFREEAGK